MSSLKTTTLSNLAGTLTVPTDTVVNGTAKAWVYFNGAEAAASMIKRSFNVSSITDGGLGNYTVNFATPFTDNQYCVQVTSNWIANASSAYQVGATIPQYNSTTPSPNRTASSIQVYNTSVSMDFCDVNVTVYR